MKHFLINQFHIDKNLLNMIKDYVFESKIVRDKNIRYKERNINYLRKRLFIKTHIYELGHTKEIIEMPNGFFIKINTETESLIKLLNEFWLKTEKSIEVEYNNFEIIKERIYANTITRPRYFSLPNIDFERETKIQMLLTIATNYDSECWQLYDKKILNDIIEFEREITINPFRDNYFMYIETRDIYKMTFSEEDGEPIFTRSGILDIDDDTILIDRHSWWKEILISDEICSMNPTTNGIYKHWSYTNNNIIGELIDGKVVLF